MNSIGSRILFTIAALTSATVAIAQYGWQEDFSHNNAGLYTNLNGGPDNLTIEKGMARFSGVEGTYYGRTDLLFPSFKHQKSHFNFGGGIVGQDVGATGFGWYSPVQEAGISVLIDRESQTLSLIEHQGFTNPIVLGSVVYQTPIWYYGFGKWHPIPRVDLSWTEWNNGWQASVSGGDPPQTYGIGPFAELPPTADMFFFMYGWESATYGPGLLDWFGNSTVPEPGALAPIVIGIGFIAIRRRTIERRMSR